CEGQSGLIQWQLDAEGRRGDDLPDAAASAQHARRRNELLAAHEARRRRQLERHQRPGRDVPGLAERGAVRPTSPSVGRSKNAKHFSGGGQVAPSYPPPEISSLRYEISTSPQGGG